MAGSPPAEHAPLGTDYERGTPLPHQGQRLGVLRPKGWGTKISRCLAGVAPGGGWPCPSKPLRACSPTRALPPLGRSWDRRSARALGAGARRHPPQEFPSPLECFSTSDFRGAGSLLSVRVPLPPKPGHFALRRFGAGRRRFPPRWGGVRACAPARPLRLPLP